MSKFEDKLVMKSISKSCSHIFLFSLFSLCHVSLIPAHISSLPLRAHCCDANLALSPVTTWRHTAPKQRQIQLCHASNWSTNNPQTHHPPISEFVLKPAPTLLTKASHKTCMWESTIYLPPWLTLKTWQDVYWRLPNCGMWCLYSTLKMEAIFPFEWSLNFYKGIYSHRFEYIHAYVYYNHEWTLLPAQWGLRFTRKWS